MQINLPVAPRRGGSGASLLHFLRPRIIIAGHLLKRPCHVGGGNSPGKSAAAAGLFPQEGGVIAHGTFSEIVVTDVPFQAMEGS